MAYQFDYYYGIEAEQFTFYKIPKILFTDERFKGLSSDAKLLYGLMLDRMSLSMKNKWLDENDRVYIYYTTENIMADLGCAAEKCTKVVTELKNIGLIEKKRQGLGKPDVIFVKNFITAIPEDNMDGFEQNSEIRKSNDKYFENQNTGNSVVKNAENRKTNTNKIDIRKTNKSKTNPIVSDVEDMMDEMREVELYAEIIKENIGYDDLMISHPLEKSTIEGIFELIFETVVSKNKSIVISSNCYPMELVKSKFLKLRYSHIKYVLECLQGNTADVKNIKKYMLAMLFNAPSTKDSYYRAQVNHDMPEFVCI